MLKIRYHKQFKKDFKLAMKRGLKANLLERSIGVFDSGKGTSCQISRSSTDSIQAL